MTFSKIKLANDQVLVQGQDRFGVEGKVVLDGSQVTEIEAQRAVRLAHIDFDNEVSSFFAPLEAAAAKLDAAHNVGTEDPNATFVLESGSQGSEPVAPVVYHLTKDSQILRLIDTNQADRLIWVNDELEITEYVAQVPTPQQYPGQVAGNADASL